MEDASLAQRSANYFRELLRKIGIELSHPTLWTKERMERGLMPDAETVEDTTVSLSFNIDVSDPFGGYVRLLHLGITIWTITIAHWSQIEVCYRFIKKSGNRFILGNTDFDTFLCYIDHLY